AAIIVSCSKQEPTELNSSPPEISQSADDILIGNKIRAFKQELTNLRENPKMKSGETMQVDSVVWYCKAALNYTYARAGVPFDKISCDSATITIPSSNGKVQISDLPSIYQQFHDSLGAKFHAVQSEDKNLVMVNLTIEESFETGTDVTLYAATSEGTPVTYGYGLFGAEDYWYWGGGLGKCDIYQGQYWGQDATTELQYKINHPISTYPPGTYFIPDTYTDWIYTWNYEDPNSPNGYYRLFLWEGLWQPQEEPCLSPDELNYYLYDGVEYIMEDYKPAGKYLTFGQVTWDISVGMTWIYTHAVKFTYGEMHNSGNPSEDL
nr:hypothetical protein [Bacteroidota bacterium]